MTLTLALALALSAAPPAKATPAEKAPKAAAPTTTACTPEQEKQGSSVCHHPETNAPAQATSEGAVVLRGEKLKGAQKVELATLLKSPGELDGKTVLVEAKVRKACERKGCWMELAGDGKGPGVRVTFKDYGFFVPLDSAGRSAKVEGTVKVAALSEETAKHYESEGATVPRGKDGKPSEVQLIATGVELRQ
jgi:pyruvate/2-oxoglutarate dehydrogenase complex dihydrolipoamide acyltransferase (E2) component